jgi:hypothetical protein
MNAKVRTRVNVAIFRSMGFLRMVAVRTGSSVAGPGNIAGVCVGLNLPGLGLGQGPGEGIPGPRRHGGRVLEG